jgi:hypothetical protein
MEFETANSTANPDADANSNLEVESSIAVTVLLICPTLGNVQAVKRFGLTSTT